MKKSTLNHPKFKKYIDKFFRETKFDRNMMDNMIFMGALRDSFEDGISIEGAKASIAFLIWSEWI
jgi:hypothetical protein